MAAKKCLAKKWRVVSVICICISAFLIFTGVHMSDRGDGFFKNLTIKAEGGAFSTQWLKYAVQSEVSGEDDSEDTKDKYSFAAWTELKNEAVSDGLYGRSENVNVIAVYGQSHCILPFGKNIDISDGNSCIVGEKTAKKLFGNDNADGLDIVWRGIKYNVKGVVKEPSELVMAGASKDLDGFGFDRISIYLTENEDRQQTGERFISAHGVSAYALRFDYKYGFSWIKEMVPCEWSDFDGWKLNFEKYKKTAGLAENTGQTVIEATGFGYKRKAFRYIILGVCFLVMSAYLYVRKE